MERSKSSSRTGCHPKTSNKINLIDHCVICLRIVKTRRKGQVTSEDGNNRSSKVATKSTATSPGIVATFNDIWSIFRNNRKDKHSSSNEVISLETLTDEGSKDKYDLSFEALTMCQPCCQKVLGVENLMKAVRQQVREISMLVTESRTREGGRLDQFEKALRDKFLEADVIQATLDFVDVSTDKPTPKFEDEDSMECHDGDEEDNSWNWNDAEDDKEDGSRSQSLGSREDNALDYVKLEIDHSDDDVVTTSSGEDEDEEETQFEDKVVSVDKTDPEPPRKSIKIKKSIVVLVQEGSSSKRVVCDMEGGGAHEFTQPTGRRPVDKDQMCDMCGETVRISQIFTHLSSHVGAEFVVKCPNAPECPRLFTNAIGLRNHFNKQIKCREVANENKFGMECEDCGLKATTRMSIRKHLESIHEKGGGGGGSSLEKEWKCPMSGCGKRFAVKQSVHLHLEVHRNQNRKLTRQNCEKCGENIYVKEMGKHFTDKHGILEKEVIGCKQCPFKFCGREELVEHLFEHRNLGILCDICGETGKEVKFEKYVEFREHYFEKHKLCPKKYNCEEEKCGALFWRKFDRIAHKMKYHGTVAEKVFECELCPDSVSFKYLDSLTSHKIRVHGAEPYKCGICGEGFSSRIKMSAHLKEHQGIEVNKFECEVEGCGMVFKMKRTLKRHGDVVHEGMKLEKFECEECGKGYRDMKVLKAHKDRVHLGERLWVCEECGENFASGSVLEGHRLIHSGERPFVCEICGQRFRQKVVLRTHLKGHERKGRDFKPNGPMKGIRKRKADDSL